MGDTTCAVDGCDGPRHGRSEFCRRCYMRDYMRKRRGQQRLTYEAPPCRECGQPVRRQTRGPRTYCSDECQREAHLRRRRDREYQPEPITCLFCGGPVAYKSRRRRFCSTRCQIDEGTRRRRWTMKGLDPDNHGLGDACGLCGSTSNLKVDHDHRCCPGERSCGKCVRGLVCHTHNVAIGMLDDDPVLLRRAAEYIELHMLRQGFELPR